MARGINTKTGLGKLGWNAAAVAGILGGIVTIAMYSGASITGPLGLLAQVGGGLGIIAVALLAIDYIK